MQTKKQQFNAQVTQCNRDLQSKKIIFIMFFFFLIARLWGEYCLSTCKHVLPLDLAETFSRFWWWETFDLEYVNSRLQDGFLYVWYSVEFLAFLLPFRKTECQTLLNHNINVCKKWIKKLLSLKLSFWDKREKIETN